MKNTYIDTVQIQTAVPGPLPELIKFDWKDSDYYIPCRCYGPKNDLWLDNYGFSEIEPGPGGAFDYSAMGVVSDWLECWATPQKTANKPAAVLARAVERWAGMKNKKPDSIGNGSFIMACMIAGFEVVPVYNPTRSKSEPISGRVNIALPRSMSQKKACGLQPLTYEEKQRLSLPLAAV